MVRGFNKSKNKKRTRPARSRTLLSALTAAVLATGGGMVGVCPAAQAAGYVYQQHTLNAGVLVNGPDPAPYLFYVLNNRPDVRPVDLNLSNPLAPAGTLPTSAAYWEVSLNSTSDSQLAQFDVLYLPAGTQAFAPATNEKLRRFVDNGGQLIVEYGAALSPAVAGLFTGTGPGTMTASVAGVPPAGIAFLRHPIITQPYLLSDTDVTGLGSFTADIGVNTLDPVHGAKMAGAPSEYANVFSPVLSGTGGTLLAAAQIGGGQAVVSALNLGPNISGHNAATFAPADLSAAPTTDLKVLANILTWSETHPSENKTSHGNASSTGLASFSPAWQYLPTPATTPPPAPSGAAVWGNFVFAVDASGTLHAFDAYPAENLTGNANATTGAETAISQYPTTSYDEIWNVPASGNPSIGTGASTPTVASFNGINYVFVERKDGSVVAFNAVTGAPYALPASPPASVSNPAPAYPQAGAVNAPAPTYYDGRLYAGQSNGMMNVYDLIEGTSAAVPLSSGTSSNTGTSEPVTAAPSVGTLADGDTNALVAVVPTLSSVYTVLLGGRNEPLSTFMVNGALAGYSINRLGRYDLGNIFADINYPSLLAYDYLGNVSSVPPTSAAPNPQDPLFAITNNAGYYTDWNMDFSNSVGPSTPPNQINLSLISADSAGDINSGGTPKQASQMSAPAIDRLGDYYYTETLTSAASAGATTTNSYLVGVKNASLYSRVQLKFRFLIPTSTGLIDADKVNYSSIANFQFVGAPVVDDQGNVYAAATNGTLATVLCFRGNQPISAIATSPTPGTIPTADLTNDNITQQDENNPSASNTIQRGPDIGVGTASATYGQFIASPPVTDASGNVTAPSSIQFYNFGKQGQTARQIVGTVTEPQPLLASPTDGTNTNTTLLMQTNLAWFVTPFPVTAASSGTNPIAGLTQVGSSLLLTDGTALYRLPTNPQVGASKMVNTPPLVTPLSVSAAVGTPLGVGAVASPPSVGGSVMVINGTNGIAARTRQVTVIADNNRVLGVDGDGSAVWAVDATTRTDSTTTLGQSVATKVPFSHPSALSQFAPNDYLVADTGSNRCVRFDSAGNVRWELTRFQDPNGLMGAGQPLTLSQPSSVMVRTLPDTAVLAGTTTLANPGGSYVYYLVADSGNDRIVEVVDRVTNTGSLFIDTNNNNATINHILTWASHTGDQDGRSYRYGSAAYYANTLTPSHLSIAATVTNTRLAPLAINATTNVVTGLGAVSGDAPGGSIVVFNYPQTPVAYSNLAGASRDLVYTTAGFYAATATANGTSTSYTPYTIRNPRFLQLASSLTASAPVNNTNPNNVPVFDFLYADDNGTFDLSYDATRKAFVAGADRLQFKASDYDNMTTPVDASSASGSLAAATYIYSRTGLPFIPTCVQALATDSQIMTGTLGGSNTATVTRRYLITQNYSQGELGTPTANGGTGKIGGEVFEIDVSAPTQTTPSAVAGGASTTIVTGAATVTAPGGFGGILIPANSSANPPTSAVVLGSTLSHPALTGPLTQPTYALRLP